jgi:hypothetical protein
MCVEKDSVPASITKFFKASDLHKMPHPYCEGDCLKCLNYSLKQENRDCPHSACGG